VTQEVVAAALLLQTTRADDDGSGHSALIQPLANVAAENRPAITHAIEQVVAELNDDKQRQRVIGALMFISSRDEVQDSPWLRDALGPESPAFNVVTALENEYEWAAIWAFWNGQRSPADLFARFGAVPFFANIRVPGTGGGHWAALADFALTSVILDASARLDDRTPGILAALYEPLVHGPIPILKTMPTPMDRLDMRFSGPERLRRPKAQSTSDSRFTAEDLRHAAVVLAAGLEAAITGDPRSAPQRFILRDPSDLGPLAFAAPVVEEWALRKSGAADVQPTLPSIDIPDELLEWARGDRTFLRRTRTRRE
jgi:hypothetical protein